MAATYKINLALQGGGSHGAYTWGVLDRFLEEDDLEISGISGTSAGAMNAAVAVDGHRKGGNAGAKKALANFWQQISNIGKVFSPFHELPNQHLLDHWNLDGTLAYQIFESTMRVLSPYQANPLNLNPLRWILSNTIDFDNLQKGNGIKLFITATEVRTGQPRVFQCDEVTEDVLMASACLPNYFQSVMIDGQAYWDGGYMGNPSIWPLIYFTDTDDVLLVQINPVYREQIPMTANDIINRLNEITFNSSLIAEMRAIHFVSEMITRNKLENEEYKNMRMHMIPAPDLVYGLNASSKMNTDWEFLQFLRDKGREKASLWIGQHKKSIGVKATLDIETEFLNSGKTPTMEATHSKPAAEIKAKVAKA